MTAPLGLFSTGDRASTTLVPIIGLVGFLSLGPGACTTGVGSGEPGSSGVPHEATASGGEAEGGHDHPDPAGPPIPKVGIANERTPMPGVTTGGKPTEAHLRAARAHGYRTVVSLLDPKDDPSEALLVAELGMRFVSIPISGPNDLTEESARALGEVFAQPDVLPLLLHCRSGNRAGALLALEAFHVEGQGAREALERGLAAGLGSLRPAVELRLGLSDPDADRVDRKRTE